MLSQTLESAFNIYFENIFGLQITPQEHEKRYLLLKIGQRDFFQFF